MDKQQLDLINLENFLGNLNSVMDTSEGFIYRGPFIDKTPRNNRKIDLRGKYPLIQNIEGASLIGLGAFDLDEDINLGYIFIESGIIEPSETYSGIYETINVRIKHPLILRNGSYIPNCSIKILREAEDGIDSNNDPNKGREDYIQHYGLIWKKSDLSKKIPTEWFLKGGRS